MYFDSRENFKHQHYEFIIDATRYCCLNKAKIVRFFIKYMLALNLEGDNLEDVAQMRYYGIITQLDLVIIINWALPTDAFPNTMYFQYVNIRTNGSRLRLQGHYCF